MGLCDNVYERVWGDDYSSVKTFLLEEYKVANPSGVALSDALKWWWTDHYGGYGTPVTSNDIFARYLLNKYRESKKMRRPRNKKRGRFL